MRRYLRRHERPIRLTIAVFTFTFYLIDPDDCATDDDTFPPLCTLETLIEK